WDDQLEFRVETSRTTYDHLRIFGPRYQAENAACAIAVCEEVLGGSLDTEALRHGLATTRLPARFEVVARNPFVIVDGAHNAEGAQALVDSIRDVLDDKRLTIVLAMLRDKPAFEVIRALHPIAARFIATTSGNVRAASAENLAEMIAATTDGHEVEAVATIGEALESARMYGEDILVTGSLTIAAPAREAARVRRV
ncbi:MAG: hypothetical protein JXE06_00865, partial [Coriobacteriia bacterium]|nr:hypothetical protein [Coriobacteriia bacterium]